MDFNSGALYGFIQTDQPGTQYRAQQCFVPAALAQRYRPINHEAYLFQCGGFCVMVYSGDVGEEFFY